jgi:chromate transporter
MPATSPRPQLEKIGLVKIFLAFLRIGAVSFGGGMSAWIRREMVLRLGWLEDRQFLAGLALSQITPGPSGINLAVFVGSVLHGAPGAVAAFSGLMTVPVFLLLIAGKLYFGAHDAAIDTWLAKALAGIAAAAIGLVLANGVRLARRNIFGVIPAVTMAATVVAIGVLRLPLLPVLAVMVPASLLLVQWGIWRGRAR